jgi:hypothetical protein
MVIIHGVYRWRPVNVAFRHDYCRRCAKGTLAVLVRTFNALHLFWVPVLPLGWWSSWTCARCNTDPHAAAQTRRGFKVAAAVILGLFNVVAWLAPKGSSSTLEVLVIGGVLLLLFALAVRWAVVHKPEPDFKANLALMPPYEAWDCPLCGAQLVKLSSAAYCPACKAEHRPLKPAGG